MCKNHLAYGIAFVLCMIMAVTLPNNGYATGYTMDQQTGFTMDGSGEVPAETWGFGDQENGSSRSQTTQNSIELEKHPYQKPNLDYGTNSGNTDYTQGGVMHPILTDKDYGIDDSEDNKRPSYNDTIEWNFNYTQDSSNHGGSTVGATPKPRNKVRNTTKSTPKTEPARQPGNVTSGTQKLSLSVYASQNNVKAGSIITAKAVAKGGSNRYTYQWTITRDGYVVVESEWSDWVSYLETGNLYQYKATEKGEYQFIVLVMDASGQMEHCASNSVYVR